MSDPNALPVVPLAEPAEAPPAMMIDTEIVGLFERGDGFQGVETRIVKFEE